MLSTTINCRRNSNAHSKTHVNSILHNDKMHNENNAKQFKGPDSQFALFFFLPFRFTANIYHHYAIEGGVQLVCFNFFFFRCDSASFYIRYIY